MASMPTVNDMMQKLLDALRAGNYSAAPTELIAGEGLKIEPLDFIFTPHVKKICECGSKKIGVPDYKPGHSDWCPVTARSSTTGK